MLQVHPSTGSLQANKQLIMITIHSHLCAPGTVASQCALRARRKLCKRTPGMRIHVKELNIKLNYLPINTEIISNSFFHCSRTSTTIEISQNYQRYPKVLLTILKKFFF